MAEIDSDQQPGPEPPGRPELNHSVSASLASLVSQPNLDEPLSLERRKNGDVADRSRHGRRQATVPSSLRFLAHRRQREPDQPPGLAERLRS